jgi:hypothetical protein
VELGVAGKVVAYRCRFDCYVCYIGIDRPRIADGCPVGRSCTAHTAVSALVTLMHECACDRCAQSQSLTMPIVARDETVPSCSLLAPQVC